MTPEIKINDDDTSSVTVKMFASAREAVGKDEVKIKLNQSMTAEDLRRNILEAYPTLSLRKIVFVLAVNHKVVVDDSNVVISSHDEVAVLPPISGG